MNPKVVIVVLNWNKPDDTIECLDSCLEIDYDNKEILIIDNHSSDDSAAKLAARYPKLQLVVTPENLGYAGGNNVGMREALRRGADYVFILNNDITLDRDVLKRLVGAAELRPDAGMLAPKVLYYDDPTMINSLGTSMDWLRLRPKLGEYNKKDSDAYPEIMEKDILVGCALLIPRKTLERVGLIDEKFFIFHEEADWCLRNLKSGYKNLVVPAAVIRHKCSKTMREFTLLTFYYSVRNFLYMSRKNAPPVGRVLTLAGLCLFSVQNAARLAFANAEGRKRARIFFTAVKDYFIGNMGKCGRTFA